MYNGASVAVVVPAYNEAFLIERTLASVPDYVDHVIVVDDASQDGTHLRVLAFADPRVCCVRHGLNRGVGAAISTGYREAFERGAQVCAVMAGDAQMDPNDLPRLLDPVVCGQAHYSKGDRLSHPEVGVRMPTARLLGNRVLSKLTRWATGLALSDSQCGYTVLSREAHERLARHRLWPRYGYPNDLLGLLAAQGARVVDVTVQPIYADERSGIGLRHALLVIPYVLLRSVLRRWHARAPWIARRRMLAARAQRSL